MNAAPQDTTDLKTILAGPARHYWRQSRGPLASLVFILPLLLLYEAGVLLLGPGAFRNGADVWLRELLDLTGVSSYYLLPLLTVAVLIGWHHTTRQHWHVEPRVFCGMLAESALLGFLLLVVAIIQWNVVARISLEAPTEAVATQATIVAAAPLPVVHRLIEFAGAGIYEEVLFRLLLLPLLYGVIGLVGTSWRIRAGGAIVLSSLAFAAAHYVAPGGESFAWFSFAFRSLAGGFFALLFVFRGFGIAAGCHALYDIFVGIL
jgi:membrane protease YdiL (CAAX protease family)